VVTTKFDPHLDLILVDVEIDGPRRQRQFTFALDTACTETLVAHHALDQIGYQARDGESIATVTSALGQEQGYRLRVTRLQALGHAFESFRVNVQDLPDNAGIDGLLGLNFLRQLNYEIRSKEGRIVAALA
jgi:predicted aspartyl protease